MARRLSRTGARRRQNLSRLRLASVMVLRGRAGGPSWVQELIATFNRLHRQDRFTTFSDALRVYADALDNIQPEVADA